jgi:hypothetical protein
MVVKPTPAPMNYARVGGVDRGVAVNELGTVTNALVGTAVITRIWQAVDSAGTVQVQPTVTIEDTRPPLIAEQLQSQTVR